MDPQHAHDLLRRERERITESLAALEPKTDDEQTADRNAELYDAELDEGLSGDLRAELAAVDRAEQRLAAGTYGLSIESGEPIPAERLEALPMAERTVEEQERYDRES
jgi:DnaK suppressor protein